MIVKPLAERSAASVLCSSCEFSATAGNEHHIHDVAESHARSNPGHIVWVQEQVSSTTTYLEPA